MACAERQLCVAFVKALNQIATLMKTSDAFQPAQEQDRASWKVAPRSRDEPQNVNFEIIGPH